MPIVNLTVKNGSVPWPVDSAMDADRRRAYPYAYQQGHQNVLERYDSTVKTSSTELRDGWFHLTWGLVGI